MTTIAQAIKRVGEDVSTRAMVDALNRTGTGAVNVIADAVRDNYPKFKKSAVKRAILKSKANRRSLVYRLIATSRPTPLGDFGSKPRKLPSGVKRPVTVGTDLSFNVQHAFWAKMPSGHVGIFENLKIKRPIAFFKGRKPPKRRTYWPIRELFGPGVADLVDEDAVIDRVIDYIDRRLPQEFVKRFEYYATRS